MLIYDGFDELLVCLRQYWTELEVGWLEVELLNGLRFL